MLSVLEEDRMGCRTPDAQCSGQGDGRGEVTKALFQVRMNWVTGMGEIDTAIIIL